MGSGFKYTLGLLGGTVALVAQLALGTFSIVTMGVTAGVAAYCKQRLIKVESNPIPLRRKSGISTSSPRSNKSKMATSFNT